MVRSVVESKVLTTCQDFGLLHTHDQQPNGFKPWFAHVCLWLSDSFRFEDSSGCVFYFASTQGISGFVSNYKTVANIFITEYNIKMTLNNIINEQISRKNADFFQGWIGLYRSCVPIVQIRGLIRLNPLAQSE